MRLLFAIALVVVQNAPSAAGPPALPTAVLQRFAAGAPVITLPPGEWRLDGPLIVRSGTRRILGDGCILVPKSGYAVWLLSAGIRPGVINHDHQVHVVGRISVGTTSLKLAEPADFRPGEIVLVKVGVRQTDPIEPVRDVWMTVDTCDGKILKFREPFGETVPDFGSRGEFEKAVGDAYQLTKVGEWGKRTADGRAARGYGTDHGIIRFAGGRPLDGVAVEGLTIKYETGFRAPAAAAFYAHYARTVSLRNVAVINPRSSAVHSLGSDDLTVDGLTITGDGHGQIYNTADTASVAVSAYGGRGHRYRNLRVDATNTALWSFEVGTVAVFEDIAYRSRLSPGSAHLVTPFGSFPGGESVTVRRGRFDFLGASYLFATGAPATTFEGCEFVQPLGRGNWWEHQYAKIEGGISIGGTRFREPRREKWSKTFTESGHFDLPAGIYLGGTVTLSTRDGVREVVAPDEVVLFDGLSGTLPRNRWEQLPPGYPVVTDQYRRGLTVHLKEMAAAVTVAVEATYLPEDRATVGLSTPGSSE